MLRISILLLRKSGTSFAGLIGLLRSPVQGGEASSPPTKKEKGGLRPPTKKESLLSFFVYNSAAALLYLAQHCSAVHWGKERSLQERKVKTQGCLQPNLR